MYMNYYKFPVLGLSSRVFYIDFFVYFSVEHRYFRNLTYLITKTPPKYSKVIYHLFPHVFSLANLSLSLDQNLNIIGQ